MFASNDMKDMVDILGDLTKPEAHVQVLCTALQFKLWHKAVSLNKKEDQDSNGKDSAESGYESVERETVKLQQAFEMERSVRHHNRAVRNCQQVTAAKRAVYTTVVDIDIHFWWSGGS